MTHDAEITTEEELRALIGTPHPRVANKDRSELSSDHRGFIAASPFCLVATSAADGSCDVSPKGDPPGRLAHVIDDTSLAIAERPGNRRADGFVNILGNPRVGLIFVVPGRGDTLRVNGVARLLRDAPYRDRLGVEGHLPSVILEVTVEQVFFHCSKAFLRSRLWDVDSWDPTRVPSRARIAQRLERPDESIEALEHYYSPERYAAHLYR